VEGTLNALLDFEADQLCGARKYQCNECLKGTRASSYDNDKLAEVVRLEG
jgi:hypothetical protein